MMRSIRLLVPLILVQLLSLSAVTWAADPPFLLPERRELLKIRSGVIQITEGEIWFELFPEDAPWHVANLKWLADKGFFKDRPFHIVKRGYILQTGALYNSELSRFFYRLPPEFNDHRHETGSLGMARVPDDGINITRQSSSTQLHILLRQVSKMDGNYTVFGKVTQGVELLSKIQQGDTIRDLVVFVRK